MTTPRGPVPVFPLPGVVLFPGATLPLHVFELRYRALVRDALAGERVLAIATLEPGWERDYQGSPAFHPLGTLGRFEEVEWRPDDCYDLRLAGVLRVRLGRQVREFPYRACDVEPRPEAPLAEDDPLTGLAREALLEQRTRMLPLGHEAWLLPPTLADDAGYATVVNVVAQSLRVSGEEKLSWLAEDSVIERGRRVLERMRRMVGGEGGAPRAGDRNN